MNNFAFNAWFMITVISTVFCCREMFRAERIYMQLLERGDDADAARHDMDQAQTFWLAAWFIVVTLSGAAVYIVNMLSK